ncbi:T9SS type A sorting domain-containing protein [Flavobacterium sp.]|uniref:T9SS type A sorting domain-containing protein n=1 Tax=Flavobacterium sp. TaxID=239 RepID=UPI0035B0761A
MKKILLSISFFSLTFFSNAQSWVEQATGFEVASRGVNEIEIVDANTVWALAYDGAVTTNNIQEFTRTTNGGSSWTYGIIDIGDTSLSINNICPISATTAWISAIDSNTGLGGIYKTTNGGLTWTLQTNSEFSTSGESFLNGVVFFDANNGVAFGDPEGNEFEIYTSNNGGTTWTRVAAASVPNPLSGEYGYNGGFRHIGSTIWLPTNKGRLLKSTNMGVTWTVSQAPLTDFSGTSQSGNVHFSTVNNGCLLKKVNTTYTFYTTTNGGTTWSAATPYTGTYYVIDYVPNTNILVATSAGTPSGSAYSLDNGTSWTTIDSGAQRGALAMFDSSTGWCGGFSTDPLTGGIFKLSGNLSNEIFTPSKFKVYPSPAKNFVTITAESTDAYSLKITDLSGKVMMSSELSGMDNTVDVSNYASGIYLFEIKSGNRTDTIKVVKN